MITLELVTLNGLKFSEEVFEVMLPTPDGIIAIFPHHMPLISLISPGVISVRRTQTDNDDTLQHFATNGGIVDIDGPRIRVLVDEAEHSEDLIEDDVKAALERAQTLARQADDKVSIDKANQIIATQQARLKVAGLRRRTTRR